VTDGSEPPDRALVRAVLEERDEPAFRALYRRHTPRLYRFALRLVGGDPRDAEDVVHETWVRAVLRLRTFAWRSTMPTWLAGISVNCARERWRPDAASLADVPEPAVDDRELLGLPDRLDLERAIGRLPARARAVLVLHDLEGYTHEEIAAMLGVEVGTSKSQLARARDRLRGLFGRQPHEGRVDP
jgi:RNA polymerase sigma-70 factor (ECF subfamily)